MFSISPEVHLLIRAKESHELWHLDGFNLTGSVDVEVSPGSWEVGLEMVVSNSSSHTLVGVDNLRGSGSGGGFIHPELTVWRSILVLTFEGILFDHRSHEDVIIISGESWGSNSGVSTTSELVVLSWLVE